MFVLGRFRKFRRFGNFRQACVLTKNVAGKPQTVTLPPKLAEHLLG